MVWAVNKTPDDLWFEALIRHTNGEVVRRCFIRREEAIAWCQTRVERGERRRRFTGVATGRA